jgi:hypothetical protein
MIFHGECPFLFDYSIWNYLSKEHPELLTTEPLCKIWEKIRADTRADSALKRLDEAGFRIWC